MISIIQEEIEKEVLIDINDYQDTVHALIGFASLYCFDSQKCEIRIGVKPFQGRRLNISSTNDELQSAENQKVITPDLGIVLRGDYGLLAEVKKNFPKEHQIRANKIFTQLKNYDQGLIGWPTNDETIDSHEIVLLIHMTVSPYTSEFYQSEFINKGLQFNRSFSIVEFSYIVQNGDAIHFRLVDGKDEEISPGKYLKYGIPVPMKALVTTYSTFKIYDAEPPLPYLLQLIWEHVLTPLASDEPNFSKLPKNRQLPIEATVREIAETLRTGFSFYPWHKDYPDRQPDAPRKDWIKKACNFLVELGEANWVPGEEPEKIRIFYRKYSNVADHFIKSYAQAEANKRLSPRMPGL